MTRYAFSPTEVRQWWTEKANGDAIYAMLQEMLARQTADELSEKTTNHENGVGFNSNDAAILTDIGLRSLVYGRLTPKQAELVRKKMVKYTRQMTEITNARQRARLEAKGKWNDAAAATEAAALKKSVKVVGINATVTVAA